jgi:hypothetical protein
MEGFGLSIVIVEEAIDGDREISDRSEDAALETALGKMAKQPSTALSHEAEVEVK